MVMGCDVSTARVSWALVNKAGKRTDGGACSNSEEALHALLAPLQARYPSLVAAVESTGTCHLAVIRACQRLALPCRLLNPIQTKQFTQNTVRGTKTDKQDAVYIALLGLQGAGYVVQPPEQPVAQARAYLRLAHRLQTTHTKLELTRQYIMTTGLELDATALVACQGHVRDTVATYRTLTADILADDPKLALLRSIPGIGTLTSMGILVEVGTIRRFPSALQLVAYAGLDPRIKQSGASSSTGRLTKRGSPYLRYWLFMAAKMAERYDPELRAAYERRRRAGKSYTVATVATARTLIHRIFAVLKRGSPYEVRAVQR